jgi:hypothetical protein
MAQDLELPNSYGVFTLFRSAVGGDAQSAAQRRCSVRVSVIRSSSDDLWDDQVHVWAESCATSSVNLAYRQSGTR